MDKPNISENFNNYSTNEEVKTYNSFDEMDLEKDIIRGVYSYGFERRKGYSCCFGDSYSCILTSLYVLSLYLDNT